MKDRSDDPSLHERTLLPRSYISLHPYATYIATERIRTTDPQFDCPSNRSAELIGKLPLATASRSTLYQHSLFALSFTTCPTPYNWIDRSWWNHWAIFWFKPVLNDWCKKDRGMCYHVYGMMHIKEPLLLMEAAGFLSRYLVLSESLNKHFLPSI